MTDTTNTPQDEAQHFDAVLCRTNAGCVAAALEYGQAGRKFALLISGGIGGLKDFAFAASALQEGQTTEHPELGSFKDWGEVKEYAASDEGVDLRPMVNLIDKYGVSAIFAVCANSLSEKQAHEADIQIVTAHRSKGLEWDRVLIYPDFPRPKDGDKLRLDDLKLAYVAVTRARLHINYAGIAWMLSGEYETEDA